MAQDEDFADLIRRVRERDNRASSDLVGKYKPELQRTIRTHLINMNLHHLMDEEDVMQSVFANFFSRAAGGQFQLDEPTNLVTLLARMARNHILDEARKFTAARRSKSRTQRADQDDCLAQVPANVFTPSRLVAGSELLTEMYKRLTDEERILADQRAQGRDWSAIAELVGGSADALRKKLARAYERVIRELNLDEILNKA